MAEEPDSAYGASAVADLLRDAKIGEMPLTWAIGGEYQYTGPSFKSLANAGSRRTCGWRRASRGRGSGA